MTDFDAHRPSPVRVVVVGSYGTGLSMELGRFPAAGETVIGRSFATGHGGKGSNQAVAAARLGAETTLVSAVGDDRFGAAAFELWADEGVDAERVRVKPDSTMVGMILVEPSGENRIVIVPGVLDRFRPDDLDCLDAALDGADILLVGLEIPVPTAFEALRIGRTAGIVTVLNPAPAPDDALPPGMLELVDHLIPNLGEAARLAGLDDSRDPHELLGSPVFADVPTLVLTLGEQGAAVSDSDGITFIPAVDVTAIDTTGAGDTFNAAYAVSIGRGLTTREATAFAVRAAGFCVTGREVIPSLPYLHDLEVATP